MKFLTFLFLCLFVNNVNSSITSIEKKDFFLNAQEVFVETKDAKIFCRVIGHGNPIIVIHGGPGLTHDYLLPQMAKLGEKNLVIFYDQRCCGLSTGTIDKKSICIKTFIEDIEAIRKTFGYKKITVLGHSWGGFLAMQYALLYPESIDKLILLNTCPASMEGYRLFLKEVALRISPYSEQLKNIEMTEGFAKRDIEIMKKYYKIIFSTYFYSSEKIQFLSFHYPPSSFVSGKQVCDILQQDAFLKSFDLHEQLKKITIPTLIIHGDSDVVPFITAQKIHESIPNSIYVLLKNCGHFSYIEAPEELFANLNTFLYPLNY
jgi:proline iminopeptidase